MNPLHTEIIEKIRAIDANRVPDPTVELVSICDLLNQRIQILENRLNAREAEDKASFNRRFEELTGVPFKPKKHDAAKK